MNRKRVVCIGVIGVGLSIGAIAQIIPGGATEFTQVLNNIELVAHGARAIAEYRAKDGKHRDPHEYAKRTVGNALRAINHARPGPSRWR